MSTNIETKMKEHTLTEFWGGNEKGVCLQVTASAPVEIKRTIIEQLQVEGFTHLTMEEAAVLHGDLARFIKKEAVRRQGLLKDVLDGMKLIEKTVFHEALDIPEDMGLGKELCISMISSLCPKSRKEIYKDGCK